MLKFVIAAIIGLMFVHSPIAGAVGHLLIVLAAVLLLMKLPRLVRDLFSPAHRI